MNAVCPYCAEQIEAAEQTPTVCATCETPHHADCWAENGGCTVFGCAAAPAEEATVSVTLPEVQQFVTPPPPPLGTGSSLPPPPPLQGSRETTFTFGGYYAPVPLTPPISGYAAAYRAPKKQNTFLLLGIFLGVFGAHNFYAGYFGRAVGQLCLTLGTLLVLSPITFIWALVEVSVVRRDALGTPMN
jgi:hypothetical protein